MPESAEAHSAHFTTNRNCTVQITNCSRTFCLVNPKVYMDSGFCHSPPQPTVRSEHTEVCSFTKDDNTATGAVGVFTYELYNMHSNCYTDTVAIMFSVPFDGNFYQNWLGVGVFELDRACDKNLYKDMYEGKDFSHFHRHEAGGSEVHFTSKAVDIRATMSSESRAIVKMEIFDKMFG